MVVCEFCSGKGVVKLDKNQRLKVRVVTLFCQESFGEDVNLLLAGG